MPRSKEYLDWFNEVGCDPRRVSRRSTSGTAPVTTGTQLWQTRKLPQSYERLVLAGTLCKPAFAENLMRLHVTITSLIWAIASLLFAVMGQKTANVWLFLCHLDLQKAIPAAASSSLAVFSLQIAAKTATTPKVSQWAKRLSSAGRPAAPETRATPATIWRARGRWRNGRDRCRARNSAPRPRPRSTP
jgi:hypothetical protein